MSTALKWAEGDNRGTGHHVFHKNIRDAQFAIDINENGHGKKTSILFYSLYSDSVGKSVN